MNISSERLAQLEDSEEKLNALEAGGVDNWEFYGEALNDYYENKNKREFIAKIRPDVEKVYSEIEVNIAENQIEASERGAGTMTRNDISEDNIKNIIKLIIMLKRQFIGKQ